MELQPVYCALLPGSGKVGYPVCTLDCLGVVLRTLNFQPFLLARTGQDVQYCTHCYSCGTILREPAGCKIHAAEPCPEWSWVATCHAAEVIEALAAITSDVTDDMVQLAQELWVNQPLTAPTLIAQLAVHRVSGIQDPRAEQ